MKQIKVTVAPDGSTQVEAMGFTGTACKKATKPIEDALGSVTKTKAKPESYVMDKNQNQNKQSNGW